MWTRALLLAAATLAPTAAGAQIVMRAEPVPSVLAGDTEWYRTGEPILHRGAQYYPAGAQTFFDGNLMVLVGEYRGVPLYADPTLETGSLVYVPVSGGLMQPYERLRTGDLAGTSGSRTPSYVPATPSSTTGFAPMGTVGRLPSPPLTSATDEPLTPPSRAQWSSAAPSEIIAPEPGVRGTGIWIEWNAEAWSAAGPAVRVGPQFTAIGTFNGRTVYRGPGDPDIIWVEAAQGLASPWRK